jgi:hypothetical protein
MHIRERMHNYGRKRKPDEETAISASTIESNEDQNSAERAVTPEEHEEEEEEEEVPQMNVIVTIVRFCISPTLASKANDSV